MMASQSRRSQHRKAQVATHCRAQNDYLFGFVIGEICMVTSLQEWVGWEIFIVFFGGIHGEQVAQPEAINAPRSPSSRVRLLFLASAALRIVLKDVRKSTSR